PISQGSPSTAPRLIAESPFPMSWSMRKNLFLVEDLVCSVAEVARACQVVSDRLLQHDPCVFRQVTLPDPPDDHREHRGRRGAIEEPLTSGVELGVEFQDTLVKRDAGAWDVERRAFIEELLRERLPARLVQSVTRELLDTSAGVLAEARVI